MCVECIECMVCSVRSLESGSYLNIDCSKSIPLSSRFGTSEWRLGGVGYIGPLLKFGRSEVHPMSPIGVPKYLYMMSICESTDVPVKRGAPLTISANIHPTLHISIEVE